MHGRINCCNSTITQFCRQQLHYIHISEYRYCNNYQPIYYCIYAWATLGNTQHCIHILSFVHKQLYTLCGMCAMCVDVFELKSLQLAFSVSVVRACWLLLLHIDVCNIYIQYTFKIVFIYFKRFNADKKDSFIAFVAINCCHLLVIPGWLVGRLVGYLLVCIYSIYIYIRFYVYIYVHTRVYVCPIFRRSLIVSQSCVYALVDSNV